MAKTIRRIKAINIRLSADESDTLETRANELGLSQAALIRQWIRDAARQRPAPMPEPEALIAAIQKAWGDKIKRQGES